MATTSVSYQKVTAATASYDEDATHATAGCDSGTTTWRDGLPIAEAARALHTTKTALRKRVERKTIRAHKGPDGQWYVVVPRRPTGGYDSRTTMSQPPDRTPSPALSAEGTESSIVVEVLKAEVVLLTDELVFLRDRLIARDREIQELHVLLQTAQRLMPVMLNRGDEAMSSALGNQPEEAQVPHDEEPLVSTHGTGREGTVPLARTGWQRFVDWLSGK